MAIALRRRKEIVRNDRTSTYCTPPSFSTVVGDEKSTVPPHSSSLCPRLPARVSHTGFQTNGAYVASGPCTHELRATSAYVPPLVYDHTSEFDAYMDDNKHDYALALNTLIKARSVLHEQHCDRDEKLLSHQWQETQATLITRRIVKRRPLPTWLMLEHARLLGTRRTKSGPRARKSLERRLTKRLNDQVTYSEAATVVTSKACLSLSKSRRSLASANKMSKMYCLTRPFISFMTLITCLVMQTPVVSARLLPTTSVIVPKLAGSYVLPHFSIIMVVLYLFIVGTVILAMAYTSRSGRKRRQSHLDAYETDTRNISFREVSRTAECFRREREAARLSRKNLPGSPSNNDRVNGQNVKRRVEKEVTSSHVDNGHHRFMLPLLPAHARTFHSAQGITAIHGVVLFPPVRRVFALMYVGISRIKTLASLFLMERVTNLDFQCGDNAFRLIQ